MKITKEIARKNALNKKRKDYKKRVLHHYRSFLKTINKYSKQGNFGIESRYLQLMPNFEAYVALRLLKIKTDFEIRIYCEDEEFSHNGIFDYGKWAHEQFGDWETRIKYIINW